MCKPPSTPIQIRKAFLCQNLRKRQELHPRFSALALLLDLSSLAWKLSWWWRYYSYYSRRQLSTCQAATIDEETYSI
jgi:hypothetical protein